jgi:hypothetical protein
LKVLKTLIAQDSSYELLIDTIECQYLSADSISQFLELVWSSGQAMNFSIWSSLCRRLVLSVTPLARNPRVPNLCIFYDSSRPFDGILSHLWNQCGQNPHLAGLIAISAADERMDRKFECYDLISDASKVDKWWATRSNEIDHYVQIDFKTGRVSPSGYSVQSPNSSCGDDYFVTSWQFEGSNDGYVWQVLDSRTNSPALYGNNREGFFSCESMSLFCFVRFLMIGKNSGGNRGLSLQRLEVFGELVERRQ